MWAWSQDLPQKRIYKLKSKFIYQQKVITWLVAVKKSKVYISFFLGQQNHHVKERKIELRVTMVKGEIIFTKVTHKRYSYIIYRDLFIHNFTQSKNSLEMDDDTSQLFIFFKSIFVWLHFVSLKNLSTIHL